MKADLDVAEDIFFGDLTEAISSKSLSGTCLKFRPPGTFFSINFFSKTLLASNSVLCLFRL